MKCFLNSVVYKKLSYIMSKQYLYKRKVEIEATCAKIQSRVDSLQSEMAKLQIALADINTV